MDNTASHKILCQSCGNEIIDPQKEIKDNDFYYHRSCLKCVECKEPRDILEKENARFKNGKVYCKTHFVTKRYSGQYFQQTPISLIGIPYYKSQKCKILKNYLTDLIPKISLFFPISEEQAKFFVKQGGIKKIKDELKATLGDDIDLFIDNFEIGSFYITIGIILKKCGEKIKNLFTGDRKAQSKTIEKAIKLIENKKVSCLENMTPNSVTFVNKKTYENKDQSSKIIKDFLEKKVNKTNSEDNNDNRSVISNSTMDSTNNINITSQEEEMIINEMEIILQNNEESLLEEMETIERTSKINEDFKKELESALKDSIFEFNTTGIVIVDKGREFDEYQSNKSNCNNCQTKFLFHGTKIDASSKILPSNFRVGKDCWYGLGIYFTDQIDYARYYWNGWDTVNSCVNKIPEIDESFSLIASEVYYDKSKFKQIFDFSKKVVINQMPNEDEIEQVFKEYKNQIVQKNGIHYVEVSGLSTHVIRGKNLEGLSRFQKNGIEGNEGVDKYNTKLYKGREYVVTYKEQILPLYALTLKRAEYCIIWYDPKFSDDNYQKELLERKNYAKQMTNFNLYFEDKIENALILIWKKKYNKIILISSCGDNCSGRNFIDRVREMMKFNIMVLFYDNSVENLNWIKNYPNSLFANTEQFFRNYICNFNQEGLLKLKNDIESHIHSNFSQFSDFRFKDFEQHLIYPLYRAEGYYSDLNCSDYYITATYKVNNEKKIKILGKNFVENNKNNFKIIYMNKIYELQEYFEIEQVVKELEIKIVPINKVINLSYMFDECSSLIYLPDISNLNTNYVTNMSYMFSNCSSLLSLPDFLDWNTSNVTDMSMMFQNCSSLLELPDISGWDISKVTSLLGMFCMCKSLISFPDISNWNTTNVSVISLMFGGCSSLKSLPDISNWKVDNITLIYAIFCEMHSLVSLPDISKWNVNKAISLENLFTLCKSLKELPDISNWNISNVYNLNQIFGGCSSLKSLPDISKWNTSKVTDMNSLFQGCSSLTSLPDISIWNTSNVTKLNSMFCECSSLSSLPDISKWNTNNVTDMSFIFRGCSKITSLPDITKWNTSNLANMSGIFYECKSLQTLPDISNWNTSKVTNINFLFYGCSLLSSLPDISKWNTSNITNMKSVFCGCTSLSSLPDISNWNTINANDMTFIFKTCPKLLSLPDLSKWNTSNLTIMMGLFYECSSLQSLPDISNWDTSKVTNISYMFLDCSLLSSLPDISNWNITNVTDMKSLFNGCISLLSLPDISKWNTNKVINMSFVFRKCSKLTSLPDISNWTTNNVTDISFLFSDCSSLLSLPDISKWNTDKVTDMHGTFANCSSITLYPDLSKWNTSNVTDMSGMFYECTKLEFLPNIINWNVQNVNNMAEIFKGYHGIKPVVDKNSFKSFVGILNNPYNLQLFAQIQKESEEKKKKEQENK